MTFHERWIIVHEFRWAMATVTTHPKKIGQNTGLGVPKWLQPSAVPRCWKANPGIWLESTPQVNWPENPTRKWGRIFLFPQVHQFHRYIWCQDVVSWKVQKLAKFILFMAWFSGCFSFLCCYGCSTATSIQFLVSLIKVTSVYVITLNMKYFRICSRWILVMKEQLRSLKFSNIFSSQVWLWLLSSNLHHRKHTQSISKNCSGGFHNHMDNSN